jgi:hypothetical protein
LAIHNIAVTSSFLVSTWQAPSILLVLYLKS